MRGVRGLTIIILVGIMSISLISCEKKNESEIGTSNYENEGIIVETLNNEDHNEIIEEHDELESDESSQLVKNGKGLLARNEYENAMNVFKEAYEIDDLNVDAHYYYSLALAKLYEADFALWHHSMNEIYEHLHQVLILNEEYINKLESEEAFNVIRDTFDYMILIGYDLNTSEDVDHILQNLNWYLPSVVGHEPIIGMITFNDDMTCIISYKSDILGIDDIVEGSYAVDGVNITIVLDDYMMMKRTYDDIVEKISKLDDVKVVEGTLKDDGNLCFDIFEYEYTSVFPILGN